MLNAAALNEDVANGDGLAAEDSAGPMGVAVRSGWSDGAPMGAGVSASWDRSALAQGAIATSWAEGEAAGTAGHSECRDLAAARGEGESRWEAGLSVGTARIEAYAALPRAAGLGRASWEPGPCAHGEGLEGWAGLIPVGVRGRDDSRAALGVVVVVAAPWARGLPALGARATAWTDAMRPAWTRRPPGGGYEPGDGGSGPGGGRWIIPLRRAYIVLHDITVRRLPDQIGILTKAFTISVDADSRDIKFSGTLLGTAALDAVQPNGDGSPVVIEVSIDGVARQFVIEDWGEDLEATSRAIRVNGRSMSSRLGAPYYLPTDRTNGQAATAQQLAIAELPLSGWSLAWNAVDWVVPAGAWSAQGQTPIQAIQAIAAAAGAIVVPARAGQGLIVKPRYPVLPWHFDQATPDVVLPKGTYTQRTMRYAVPTQGNAVFLQGGAAGGVLARVYRAQTAGDRLVPPVQDNLLTHVDAARARGERILAGQHQQPLIKSFSMPIGGSLFPQVQIGQLIRLETSRGAVLGIANSEQIEFSLSGQELNLRQTISLGEETPNTWAAFAALMPADPQLVGEIQASGNDGRVSVALTGGGTVWVLGEGSVGQKVYVRSGRVVGTAPGLPSFDIDV
jgi:hypothetical protein